MYVFYCKNLYTRRNFEFNFGRTMFHRARNIFFYNCRIFAPKEKFAVLHSNSFYEASFKEDAEAGTRIFM